MPWFFFFILLFFPCLETFTHHLQKSLLAYLKKECDAKVPELIWDSSSMLPIPVKTSHIQTHILFLLPFFIVRWRKLLWNLWKKIWLTCDKSTVGHFPLKDSPSYSPEDCQQTNIQFTCYFVSCFVLFCFPCKYFLINCMEWMQRLTDFSSYICLHGFGRKCSVVLQWNPSLSMFMSR